MRNNYGKTRNTQAWGECKQTVGTQLRDRFCKTPKNNEI